MPKIINGISTGVTFFLYFFYQLSLVHKIIFERTLPVIFSLYVSLLLEG